MPITSSRALSMALAATLLVFTATSVAAAWAVSDSLAGAGVVARREEQTAYRVSAVALEVSRLRAHLVEGLVDTDRPRQERLAEARAAIAAIEEARATLPSLLGPEEAAVWSVIEPRLDGSIVRFDGVIAALEAGDEPLAKALLDQSEADAVRLSDDLDLFREISVDETKRAVAGIQTQAARTLRIAVLAWAGMLTVLVLVWTLILRVVAAQRRSLAVKMNALESANRELDAFAGRIAHDMRNVLSPIQLGVAVIEKRTGDPLLRQLAERIARSCGRGRALVDGLLLFSRIGGQAHGSAKAAIAKELADVLDQLQDPIREAGIKVTTRVHEDARVAIPPALLHVVLLNLVGNAVKFMKGRTERRLAIECTQSANASTIIIADTGPGIPEQELARVFDAFYRGGQARGGGVGLGLATVKRIVESHGGRIEVASERGRGATFYVVLPRAAASVASVADVGAAKVRRRWIGWRPPKVSPQ